MLIFIVLDKAVSIMPFLKCVKMRWNQICACLLDVSCSETNSSRGGNRTVETF